MSVNDGGPAFPIPREAIGNTGKFNIVGSEGMSLRDWFAGMALSGLCRTFRETPATSGVGWQKAIAWSAYSLADAMINERKKEGEE